MAISHAKSPLLKDIMQWKKTTVFYASHVFREGNQVADHLANCALSRDFYYTQQSVLSSQLVILLQADSRSNAFSRRKNGT